MATLKKKRYKKNFETFLKNNQNTINFIVVFVSLGLSVFSILLSLKNEKTNRTQQEILNQPIWKNSVVNAGEHGAYIKFEPLKEGVIIQEILVTLPSDYTGATSSIKGDTWYIEELEDHLLNYFNYPHFHSKGILDLSAPTTEEFIYPIAITYFYLQNNVLKEFSALYDVIFNSYNGRKIKTKTLLYRNRLTGKENIGSYIDIINNYEGINTVKFLCSQESDSILNEHIETKQFFNFLNRHCVEEYPVIVPCPDGDLNDIYEWELTLPSFLHNSKLEENFLDSLDVFSKRISTREMANKIIEFVNNIADAFSDSLNLTVGQMWHNLDYRTRWWVLLLNVKRDLYWMIHNNKVDLLRLDGSEKIDYYH